MWLMDRVPSRASSGMVIVAHIDAAAAGAVHVEKAGAWLAHIAGEGDERRERAEHVASLPLALHALPEPEQ